MTIYKDGISVEEIHLHEYEQYEDTAEKLHALFAEKGFERLTEEETKQRIADMQQAEEKMKNVRKEEYMEMKRKKREAIESERRTRKLEAEESGEEL